MAERVTIQDIADELGLSRNTVSKAINNTGVLADATKEKILKKAVEMGYKQFSYINLGEAQLSSAPNISVVGGEIALLTGNILGNSHFSATMIDKFQGDISKMGYSLSIHRVSQDDFDNLTLPLSFIKEKVSGIICFELFDLEYAQMLCDLQIPTLFVDTPPLIGKKLPSDILYMNNTDCIYDFVGDMKSRGKEKIGFIGNIMNCQSFYERYTAFHNAMLYYGLDFNPDYTVTNPSPTKKYATYLEKCLKNMKDLPEVFICANDFVATDAILVFRKMGISVPDDIYVFGFDDAPEAKILTPSLSTVHIHSQIMGYSAVQLLLSRISEPTLNYRTVYTETTIKYRESTGN